MAEDLKVSQPHISESEADHNPLGVDLCIRIYDQHRVQLGSLGISLEDLVRWGRG